MTTFIFTRCNPQFKGSEEGDREVGWSSSKTELVKTKQVLAWQVLGTWEGFSASTHSTADQVCSAYPEHLKALKETRCMD